LVAHGVGRIARRTDGKYFLYLPKHVAEDSAFPFDASESPVPVIIQIDGKRLIIVPTRKPKAIQ
jgi:hypothetical protein